MDFNANVKKKMNKKDTQKEGVATFLILHYSKTWINPTIRSKSQTWVAYR